MSLAEAADQTLGRVTDADTAGFDAITPWAEETWRAEVLAWITEHLARRGLRPSTDGLKVRLRPWSVLVRVPLEGGSCVWFKANPPAARYEARLAEALHTWVPGQVLAPLAVDTERGWTLHRHGGELFGDLAADPQAWQDALLQYAVLQRTVSAHRDELLAFGVPDMRPAVLVPVFGVITHRTGGLDDRVHGALRQLTGRFAGWCAELEASGIPATLDHSDLQEGQMFRAGGGSYVFHDWDSASVGMPFTSLLVVARVVRERFGDEAPAVLARLRDVYLEPWTDDGHSLAELRRLADLATRVGPVGRAFRALTPGRMFPGSELDLRAMHSVGVQEGLAATCGLLTAA